MAVINRVPRGLLSFFDAKTGGNTPSEIDPRLSVGVDATAFYASDLVLRVEAGLSAGVVGPGINALVTVPTGELWMVYAVSSRITATAINAVGQIAPSVNIPFGGIVELTPMNTLQGVALPIGDSLGNSVSYSQPLFFGAGTEIGTYQYRATGACTLVTSVLHRSLLI